MLGSDHSAHGVNEEARANGTSANATRAEAALRSCLCHGVKMSASKALGIIILSG